MTVVFHPEIKAGGTCRQEESLCIITITITSGFRPHHPWPHSQFMRGLGTRLHHPQLECATLKHCYLQLAMELVVLLHSHLAPALGSRTYHMIFT